MLDKCNLRREGFFSGLQSAGLQSVLLRRHGGKRGACSQEAERDENWCSAQFLLFLPVWGPSPWVAIFTKNESSYLNQHMLEIPVSRPAQKLSSA